jgi:hypothetical protein
MKRKLNVIATTIIIGLIGSAYATCYLNNTAICKNVGDVVGSTWKSCSNGLTYTYNIYADEVAYKRGVHSTAIGGFSTTTVVEFCDRYDPPNYDRGVFNVYYMDPCNGTAKVPDFNGYGQPFQYQFTSTITDGGTCVH